MRAILANPRYTGHQVWNRQRRDEVLIDVEDWALATRPRCVGTTTPTGSGPSSPCSNGKAYYRGRFAGDYGIDANEHPRCIYVKEGGHRPRPRRMARRPVRHEHLDHTCVVLAGAAACEPDYETRQADLEAKIRDCDRRLAGDREALEHVEGEVAPIARWEVVTEVQRERKGLESLLGRSVPGGKLTTAQVKALVGALRDIVGVLADADPADKAERYGELGVSPVYHPDGR